jgi:hypothetical protein
MGTIAVSGALHTGLPLSDQACLAALHIPWRHHVDERWVLTSRVAFQVGLLFVAGSTQKKLYTIGCTTNHLQP